ncbi:sigma factor-like helix-turn-helix DNA-binding protein, partial [uncultured Oscillibacter sp.]|uniref:sigma factor-like helix-turn-helix DNA-binding protein n=1 Tax=uncultured Oscillibacter sp. TaxID=876091 RepID=UPI002613F800
MADVKKVATRDSYGNALKELGAQVDNLVVMDADLAGATKTAMFKAEYPDRFFDCGIAEANMVGVAAGLSTMGLVPFVSTFAMFAAGRAYEQIRKAYYSLDADDGIEYSACLRELTPDEVLELKERFCRLWNALNSLPETQGRRVDAHFILGMTYREIAQAEGVDKSSVRESVLSGLK